MLIPDEKTMRMLERQAKTLDRLAPEIKCIAKAQRSLPEEFFSPRVADNVSEAARLAAENLASTDVFGKVATSAIGEVQKAGAIQTSKALHSMTPSIQDQMRETLKKICSIEKSETLTIAGNFRPIFKQLNAYVVEQAYSSLASIRTAGMIDFKSVVNIPKVTFPSRAQIASLSRISQMMDPFYDMYRGLKPLFDLFDEIMRIPLVQKAWEAYEKGRRGIRKGADWFIRRVLCMSVPSGMEDDYCAALLEFLEECFDSPFQVLIRWAKLPQNQAVKYLKAVISRKARNRKRRREKADLPFGGKKTAPAMMLFDEDIHADPAFLFEDDPAKRVEDEYVAAALDEQFRLWREIVREICATGTPAEKRIIWRMWSDNECELADLRTIASKSQLQALQRKAQRRVARMEREKEKREHRR